MAANCFNFVETEFCMIGFITIFTPAIYSGLCSGEIRHFNVLYFGCCYFILVLVLCISNSNRI